MDIHTYTHDLRIHADCVRIHTICIYIYIYNSIVYIYIYIYIHICKQICKYTYVPIHIQLCTHAYTHTRIHAYTHTRIHAQAQAQKQAQAQAQAQAQTHTHTHTHTENKYITDHIHTGPPCAAHRQDETAKMSERREHPSDDCPSLYVNVLMKSAAALDISGRPLSIHISIDELGFERISMTDIDENFLMLAAWFEKFSKPPVTSIMAKAFLHMDSQGGRKHSSAMRIASQTCWAKYEADKYHLICSYVLRCYRRSKNSARSVALARLKMMLDDHARHADTGDASASAECSSLPSSAADARTMPSAAGQELPAYPSSPGSCFDEGVESGEDDMDSKDAGQDKGQEHNAAENGRMVSGLVGVRNRSGVWNVCCFWLLFPERLLHVLRHG